MHSGLHPKVFPTETGFFVCCTEYTNFSHLPDCFIAMNCDVCFSSHSALMFLFLHASYVGIVSE